MKNRKNLKFMAGPYMVWAIGFILIPLFIMFYFGLTDRNGTTSLANVLSIATPEHSKALSLSISLAVAATGICLLLGYPLAAILAHMKNSSGVIIFVFILPMWMNFLLRTLAWQTLLEKTGVINTMLTTLHLPTINIINTSHAIVLGMVYNFLPFMVLPLYNSLTKIDENVINAAADLGANSFQTFFKIILPLTVPGIMSGITMVFVPSLTTFVISKLLGGSKILLIGNVIEEQFTQAANWHLGSGLSIVLMLFIVVNMLITAIFDRDGEGSLL